MSDPTYVINLQRTLEMHIQEQLRIKAELEGYLRQVSRCEDQLRATQETIDKLARDIEDAIELSRRQVADPYDRRGPDLRTGVRSDDRYDRYDQRRDSRYAPRDSRYDARYDRPQYRDDDPRYRQARPSAVHPADIERAIESVHADDQASNVRFADFRIPQAATIVLREASKPMHVSDIFQKMLDGGFEFRGQHQQITLAVSLARSKRFRKVAPGTFELDPAYQAGQVA